MQASIDCVPFFKKQLMSMLILMVENCLILLAFNYFSGMIIPVRENAL